MGTNVKQELSFDGFGVNSSDEHKTRIARFLKTDEAMVYGPLFAAAPELLASVDELRDAVDQMQRQLQVDQLPYDLGGILQRSAKAYLKAKGQ